MRLTVPEAYLTAPKMPSSRILSSLAKVVRGSQKNDKIAKSLSCHHAIEGLHPDIKVELDSFIGIVKSA